MTDNRPPAVVVQPAQGVIGVASDTIGALRGTPMLLVIVLLNCAFLGAAAYYLRGQQANAYRLVDKILDRCLLEGTPGKRPDSSHEGGDYSPSPLGSLP